MKKLLTLLLLVSTASFGAAIISAPTVYPSGNVVDINVDIFGVTDLYAFQFDFSFDPTILSATNVTEGSFLSSAGGFTFFLPGSIDNTAGVISFTADSLAGPVSGVSGGGHLANFHFLEIAGPNSSSITPLTISSVTLLDSGLNDIPFTISNGQVVIPEPASGALLLASLVIVVALKRRVGIASILRMAHFSGFLD